MAHLFVNPSHGNQGIGQRLAQFVEDQAREQGLKKLVTLSTRSYAFFTNKNGFLAGTVEDLPVPRRKIHAALGRNSKILVNTLH